MPFNPEYPEDTWTELTKHYKRKSGSVGLGKLSDSLSVVMCLSLQDGGKGQFKKSLSCTLSKGEIGVLVKNEDTFLDQVVMVDFRVAGCPMPCVVDPRSSPGTSKTNRGRIDVPPAVLGTWSNRDHYTPRIYAVVEDGNRTVTPSGITLTIGVEGAGGGPGANLKRNRSRPVFDSTNDGHFSLNLSGSL